MKKSISFGTSLRGFCYSLIASAAVTFFILVWIFGSVLFIQHDRQTGFSASGTTKQSKPEVHIARNIYYGVYLPGVPASMSALTSFETKTRKSVSLVMWYQQWGSANGLQNFQPAWMDNVRNHGAIPYVTWEPWVEGAGVNQPDYSLKNIINGRFDSYISQWALAAKAWNHPFFLRFAHEMNANWYPWDEGVNGNAAGQYVQAWKHVHTIFAENDVTNVTWVWCPSVEGTIADLSKYYPGASYIGWTCLDGYNWGRTQSNTSWESFDTVFGKTYKEVSSFSSKPMMVGEMASAEKGGNKANWITDTFLMSLPKRFPHIQAITWFDINKETDWRIESSQAAQDAFATAIQANIYKSNSYKNISKTPIPAP